MVVSMKAISGSVYAGHCTARGRITIHNKHAPARRISDAAMETSAAAALSNVRAKIQDSRLFRMVRILLDHMEFHDSFALLKWKIESVTLAPLLTPEDTKKQGLETVHWTQLFHACGNICEYLTLFY
jgi:hypothetical protein